MCSSGGHLLHHLCRDDLLFSGGEQASATASARRLVSPSSQSVASSSRSAIVSGEELVVLGVAPDLVEMAWTTAANFAFSTSPRYGSIAVDCSFASTAATKATYSCAAPPELQARLLEPKGCFFLHRHLTEEAPRQLVLSSPALTYKGL